MADSSEWQGTNTSDDGKMSLYERVSLAALLSVVAAFSLLYASRQPLNGDEYLVLETVRPGSLAAVWHLLKTAPLAVDPPLYHFLLVYWTRIFGLTEFSIRVPSVLAYTLMTFLLYRFVRRYTDVYTGFTVVVFSLQCGAFAYSYHARPYTVVLAADALALFLWSRLIEKRQERRLELVGLFVAVTIALGSHWFGFLVLVPLAFAEALRTWQTGRMDRPIWAAFAAGCATGIPYLLLLKAAAKYRTLPWKGVQLSDIGHSYRLVLAPCVAPLGMLLIAFAVAHLVPDMRAKRQRASSVPMPVFVCLAALAALPFAGFVVGKFVSNVLEPRYVLPCALGLLVLVSLAIRDIARQHAAGVIASTLIVGGYAFLYYYSGLSSMPAAGDAATFADASVLSATPELPVVPADYDLFLRLKAHGAASMRDRCVLPTDLSSIRLLHRNTEFLTVDALRFWTRLPIVDLASFLKLHPRFYLIERPDVQGWLIQYLLENHADAVFRGTYGGNPVYLVHVPG